jgi:hypothetical protein
MNHQHSNELSHWVFFSYVGERFFFARPHIAEGLYSYQKGWLVYTPIMTFSVLGFVALWKYVKESFLAVFLSFAVFVYVLMSWWTWWYGGSFGQRVFIDFYPLLALPFGAFFHFIQRRHLRIQDFTYYIAGVLIFWNLFQTWEYNEGLLHYDSMTEEAYWRGFFQTKSSTQYWQSLKPPNSYAAIRGIHEKFVGVEGFEQETTPDSALKQLNYSQHREGKSSFTVNEAFPSTEPLVISMSYLLDRRGQGLRISVYVYMPEAFKQEDQEQASLLTSVEGPDGKIIVSKVIQLYGKCKKGTWTQVKDDLPISESFRNANVKISVRNSSKEKILVDDLQVEIR